MRTIAALTIATATLLTSPAAEAGPNDPTWNPPARYDHPFTGKVVLRRYAQRYLKSACDDLFARHHIKVETTYGMRGCSAAKGNRCEILTVDRTFEGATPNAVLRHEMGHCNGWPADHPA